MKSVEQYFVVLFIMLYKVVLTERLALWMKCSSVTIQMRATEQLCLLYQYTEGVPNF